MLDVSAPAHASWVDWLISTARRHVDESSGQSGRSSEPAAIVAHTDDSQADNAFRKFRGRLTTLSPSAGEEVIYDYYSVPPLVKVVVRWEMQGAEGSGVAIHVGFVFESQRCRIEGFSLVDLTDADRQRHMGLVQMPALSGKEVRRKWGPELSISLGRKTRE